MDTIWQWFNGRKTTIGAIFLFIGVVLEQVGQGIWELNYDWIPKAVDTANWIGMALTATGLVHKGVKIISPSEEGEGQ